MQDPISSDISQGGEFCGNVPRFSIHCSVEEANRVRSEAVHERRTISGYVLNILARAIRFDDRLAAQLSQYQQMNRILARTPLLSPGKRTALLIRCTQQEAASIRLAAERRQATISGFVVHCLRRSWQVNLGAPTL